ncbi:hypothetical protein DVR12_19655 [Chitinophaga silvatica]|uniref:TraB/GumN family protein n=2 Tax=Chitinophaga silvatica TaxID=2282649 RepID=A0A3E1Y5D3_9BACT|nr:hypothetical protein DVR12_19655 [Chitinophaga silvatica]
MFLAIGLCGQSVLPDRPNTLVWEVTSKKKPQYKSYIIGSNHLYGEKLLNSLRGVKDLILKSDLVIAESLPKTNEERQLSFDQKIPYNTLFSNQEIVILDSFLTTHQIANIKALDSAHFPVSRLLYIVFSELTAENNSDLQQLEEAMDNVIVRWAKDANIPLVGLDSGMTMKKDVLSLGMEDIQMAEAIRSFVISPSLLKTDDSLRNIGGRYARMEIDYSFKSKPVYIENESLRYLLVERNKYWMSRLPDYLSNKNCFVVIGIDHLKYKEGLLASLSKLGFNIRPVKLSLSL